MRRFATILSALLLGALRNAAAAQSAPDFILRGGSVVDGTGAPARRADVAIRQGMISAVASRLVGGRDTHVIDVSGLVVAPGFIDAHAHISDIAQQPDAENFLRQGVTTIFNSLHSLDQPDPLGAFLDTLHVAPNTLWTAGHTWARSRVMGRENRAPTTQELDSMTALVARAMDDGAFGLGTGLEYIPARYAETAELVALARAAKRPGSLYVTHLRDEGAALEQAVAEAIDVGRMSGQPVHISHIKSTGSGNWGKSTAVLHRIDAATARGVRVSFDVYPYAAYSTYSDVLFPGWVLADGPDSIRARLTNAEQLRRVQTEMRPIFLAQTGGTAASVRFRTIPQAPQFTGRTLADYLAAQNAPQSLDAIIEALIELQRDGGFTATVDAMSERDINAFLRHPGSMVSTDGDLVVPGKGFPHPRSYGAFPRVIARYVGERHVLTFESAIAKMTGVPARALGLRDRGMLRAGLRADLVVFDRARFVDRATFTDPHHYAEGVVHLFVNGQAVIRDGTLTGARPGRAVRRRN
ncbi:MAG: amidohydrolase family protein [Gemmatimonadaceae bacterium]|nr:amidohydrolase family protein [Gemmatimonadaceae bacterium]